VTTDPCRDWRGALGAAALGVIDPIEEIGLRAHLDGCEACRAELRDLTAVAGALSAVSAASIVGAPPEPSGALAGRVLARVAEERVAKHRRRTRRIAAGVGALAVAAAIVVGLLVATGTNTGPSGNRIAMTGPNGAKATAILRTQAVGTAIDVKVSGLDPHRYYWLWLTGDDEHRMAAGTFTGSNDPSEIKLSAALPLNDARRIWVTDEDNQVVLDARIPASA
jgi:anti-sigma factor RsiW